MKFGEFEVDVALGALLRNGERVKLQELPFRMLVRLLRQPGAVISREELRAELWGVTYVDAEAGLNTAAAKLREALGDTADAPQFIETIPKRGYRFIGTLTRTSPANPWGFYAVLGSRRATRVQAVIIVVCAAVGAYAYYGWNPARVTIAVVRFHNETGRADLDRMAGSLTDAVVVSLAGNRRNGVIGNSPLLVTDRIFEDVQKIGSALKAEYVLLGQLQNGDAGLVARAHFIRVSDQTHLWAGKIELAEGAGAERLVTTAVETGIAAAFKNSPHPTKNN